MRLSSLMACASVLTIFMTLATVYAFPGLQETDLFYSSSSSTARRTFTPTQKRPSLLPPGVDDQESSEGRKLDNRLFHHVLAIVRQLHGLEHGHMSRYSLIKEDVQAMPKEPRDGDDVFVKALSKHWQAFGADFEDKYMDVIKHSNRQFLVGQSSFSVLKDSLLIWLRMVLRKTQPQKKIRISESGVMVVKVKNP